jgi:hypothetical protein
MPIIVKEACFKATFWHAEKTSFEFILEEI